MKARIPNQPAGGNMMKRIQEMQANGTLTLNTPKADPSELSDEDASDIGEFMSAFRK